MTSFWKIENTGAEFEETADTSTESKRAIQILQDTIHHIGDRYEIGLLWKQDSKLENNYPVAKAQLDSLQRRLNKDIELKQLRKNFGKRFEERLCHISYFLKSSTREDLVPSSSPRHQSQQTWEGRRVATPHLFLRSNR